MSNRRTWLLVAAFVAIAALGVGAGYLLSGGSSKKANTGAGSSTDSGSGGSSSSSSSSSPNTIAPPTTISTKGLDPAAAELAAAINKASGLTYHAVYTGTRTSSTGATAQLTVEVWRQLPLARRDTVIKSDKGTVHTEELRLPDKLTGCIDTSLGNGTPSWTCVPKTDAGIDPADPIIGVARPVNGKVTARNDHVGSIEVRCFSVVVPDKTAPQEACFDSDGIPAAIDGGDGRLERTQVGRGVDPATITLPAGAKDAPGVVSTTTTVT